MDGITDTATPPQTVAHAGVSKTDDDARSERADTLAALSRKNLGTSLKILRRKRFVDKVAENQTPDLICRPTPMGILSSNKKIC